MMGTKPQKNATRKVQNLKVKSLSATRAKRVKGGPINPPWRDQSGATQLLPAPQKAPE
jgi:hypothetical protein